MEIGIGSLEDELLTAGNGESSISYEDYAIALVDEIETPRHHRQRFTVGYYSGIQGS